MRKNFHWIFGLLSLTYLVCVLAFSNAHARSSKPVVVKPTPTPVQETVLDPIKVDGYRLSWEMKINDGQVNQAAQPYRAAWTIFLLDELNKNYDVLMSAKDIDTIIPKRSSLTREQHLLVLAELISTLSEYESDWNVKKVAKDTNGLSGEKYKARGLCQMNAALDRYGDQINYRTGTKYTWQDLEDPFVNLELCVKIMVTLVKVRGKITFASHEKSPVLRYFFATLVTDTAYGKKTLKAAHARIADLVILF